MPTSLSELVAIGQGALLEACNGFAIPPMEKAPIIELRAQIASAYPAITHQVLRDWGFELLDLFHEIADRLYNPRLPRLQNTDGEPLLLHASASSCTTSWAPSTSSAATSASSAKSSRARSRSRSMLSISERPFSAHWIASLQPEQRQAIVEAMNPEQLKELQTWRRRARDEQIPPPGDWRVWLYMAGRGAGKTRSGAEWVCTQVGTGRKRIALVAPTAADSSCTTSAPPWSISVATRSFRHQAQAARRPRQGQY